MICDHFLIASKSVQRASLSCRHRRQYTGYGGIHLTRVAVQAALRAAIISESRIFLQIAPGSKISAAAQRSCVGR